MADEIWKPVVGYEGFYSVSNMGRVRRDYPTKNAGGPRLMKGWIITNGYVMVELTHNGESRKYVHAIVAAAFIGERPTGLDVNHKNGIKTDNRDCNLEYCTRSENIKHAVDTGLGLRGSEKPGSKLTEAVVRLLRATMSPNDLRFISSAAKQYGVAKTTIAKAIDGRTWKHVSPERA